MSGIISFSLPCHQAGDSDLKELIQITTDDAQVLQALKQRYALVLRLRQDTTVECEQRQLTIQRSGTHIGVHSGRACPDRSCRFCISICAHAQSLFNDRDTFIT